MDSAEVLVRSSFLELGYDKWAVESCLRSKTKA
jgi:hypothetical protein